MEQIMFIKEAPVFVRVDDVGAGDFPSLREIVSICKEAGIPVILGVIPSRLSQETVVYLQRELHNNWAGLIIAQHGVTHIPEAGSVRKMEFAIGRTVEDVAQKLCRGKQILINMLGIDVDWYIPPWNKFGRNLINALGKNGYRAFSASKDVPFQSNSLFNFPVNQDIVIDYITGEIEMDIQVWLDETRKNLARDGKAGLMLHHHLMGQQHIDLFKKWAESC